MSSQSPKYCWFYLPNIFLLSALPPSPHYYPSSLVNVLVSCKYVVLLTVASSGHSISHLQSSDTNSLICCHNPFRSLLLKAPMAVVLIVWGFKSLDNMMKFIDSSIFSAYVYWLFWITLHFFHKSGIVRMLWTIVVLFLMLSSFA